MENKILHNIRTVSGEAGDLSFFEGNKDIPFQIKRIYYISNVPKGTTRGFHAHKQLKQFLICLNGKVEIELDDGCSKAAHLLTSVANEGLLIDSCIWRTMKFLEEGSILLVAASEYYDESDYIRDYSDFKKYLEKRNLK